MLSDSDLISRFDSLHGGAALHSWTLPYGDLVTRPGRIVGRFFAVNFAPKRRLFRKTRRLDLGLLKRLPFRAFAFKEPHPYDTFQGRWEARHHRMTYSLWHRSPTASIVIEDMFSEQGDLVPEPEVDVFLKWFLDCFRTDLNIEFKLGVHTAAVYHGDLPNIHDSGRRPWRELEDLVHGRLQPSYGKLDNLNYRL